jgi:Tfp pilus assembly protein PilV
MESRPAVSLVEVLVATVLLAVGVSGTLSSLSAAARLRAGASGREALADAVQDRLGWFEAVACATADSIAADSAAGGVEVRWELRAIPAGRTLRLEASAPWAARPHEMTLATSLPCVAE